MLIFATLLAHVGAQGYTLTNFRWTDETVADLRYTYDSYLDQKWTGPVFWSATGSWEYHVDGVPDFTEVSSGEDISIESWESYENGVLAYWQPVDYQWNGVFYWLYYSVIKINTWYIEECYYTCDEHRQRIAAHELGHALGLGDLYGTFDEFKLMYGWDNYVDTGIYDPKDDDINGLWAIYGV